MKRKEVVYVKSVKDIMKLAGKMGARIGDDGTLIFIDGHPHQRFETYYFKYCGKPKPDFFEALPEWLETRIILEISMKRKTLKLLKKIQKETKGIECRECGYRTEFNDCIFIECPANWELPPLPREKKTVTYVKSIKKIMQLAYEEGAKIGPHAIIFDLKKYCPHIFLFEMFEKCGMKVDYLEKRGSGQCEY